MAGRPSQPAIATALVLAVVVSCGPASTSTTTRDEPSPTMTASPAPTPKKTTAPRPKPLPHPELRGLVLPTQGLAVERRRGVTLYATDGTRLAFIRNVEFQDYNFYDHPRLRDRIGAVATLVGGTLRFAGVKVPRRMGLPRGCNTTDRRQGASLMTCDETSTRPPRLVSEVDGERQTITGSAYRPNRGYYHGSWRWAFWSRDGRSVLAQWSGECEVPEAYLVDVATGRRHTIGRIAYGTPPNSFGLGWRSDGLALVDMPEDPACGFGDEPGVFAVAPDGTMQFRVLTHPANASVRMWG